MGGGNAGSGGYNYQAHAIAYVSACILTGRALRWVNQQFGRPDVPIAVSAETGGPGDDIRVELGFATFEAQVKRGLKADARLDETIERFGKALAADPDARGVIIVDRTSSQTVKEELAGDLQRLRDGLDDDLKEVTTRVLDRLAAIGITTPKEVASRISVVMLDLEDTGAHAELSQFSLRWRLETPTDDGGASPSRLMAEADWSELDLLNVILRFLNTRVALTFSADSLHGGPKISWRPNEQRACIRSGVTTRS